MSLRLRLENERMLQVKEEEVIEDKLKILKERMYAPVIWRELEDDIKIIDLKEERYAEVLEMIEEYFLPEDVLTKNSEMSDDEVSKKSFMDQCMFQMRDTTSLVAINYALDPPDLVGCCLNRVVHKDDFGRVFSGTIMKDGEAQEKCMKIRRTLSRKVNIFESFNCDVYLKIYTVCIKPEYRHCDYGTDFLKCTFNSARSLHIPVVMGIFTAHTIQRRAKKLGMKVMFEIEYCKWTNKETGLLIFDDPGAGNYTIACMAGNVPDEPFKDKPHKNVEEEVVEEKPPVLTRADRREMVAKRNRRLARLNQQS
nr:uncharacterized protein LOC111428034 [Onthophagus taurus]XP_022919200.1 uncharacterized protein LOC111428034 [Onthophagus taurus]